MDTLYLVVVALKIVFTVLSIYNVACLFSIIKLAKGNVGSFTVTLLRFNIYVKIFGIDIDTFLNKNVTNRANIVHTIKKTGLALKTVAVATAVSIVLTLVASIGEGILVQYTMQLKVASTIVQWFKNRDDDEIEDATKRNYGVGTDAGSEIGNETEAATCKLLQDFPGPGTIVENVAVQVSLAYGVAKDEGQSISYSNDDTPGVNTVVNGKQINSRSDCTGFLNAILWAMGYMPPGYDASKDDYGHPSSWSYVNAEKIRDENGNETDDWQKIAWSKDALQPGDFQVVGGHGELFGGWSGSTGYGWNMGYDTAIATDIKMAKECVALPADGSGGDYMSIYTKYKPVVFQGHDSYTYIWRYVGEGSPTWLQTHKTTTNPKKGTHGGSLTDILGTFTKYTNMTEEQLRRLAAKCKTENDNSTKSNNEEAIKFQASLMCNLFERENKKRPGRWKSVYDYVVNGGWFSGMDGLNMKLANDEAVGFVKDVMVNGNRIVPVYIDEHDWYEDYLCSYKGDPIKEYGDINHISGPGKVTDWTTWVSGQTILHNCLAGSNRRQHKVSKEGWVFWCFPTGQRDNSRGGHIDPFGFKKDTLKLYGLTLEDVIPYEEVSAYYPWKQSGSVKSLADTEVYGDPSDSAWASQNFESVAEGSLAAIYVACISALAYDESNQKYHYKRREGNGRCTCGGAYDIPHYDMMGGTYVKLEINEQDCKDWRPDCSGYMASINYLLDGGGKTSDNGTALGTRVSSNTDWVMLDYTSKDVLQPGDIMFKLGVHTEMYAGTVNGQMYGFNFGSCKGINAAIKASKAILSGTDVMQALVDADSTVSIGPGSHSARRIQRYTGDGKGTLIDQLGALNGLDFNNSNKDANASDANSNTNANPELSVYNKADWVRVKDMFRHGGQYIGEEQNTDSNSETSYRDYKLGDATGKYTIQLSSGKFYWYHQAIVSDSCDYCGDWTSMLWGTDMVKTSLGLDGDSIYTAAIAVSNLVNKDITPKIILNDIGCKINGSDCDTTGCSLLNNKTVVNDEEFVKYLGTKYNLTVDLNLATLDETNAKAKVDEMLGKGGVIIIKVSGDPDSSCWWPETTLNGHYTTIYKRNGDDYFLLDQTFNDNALMDKAVTFNSIYSRLDGAMIGIYNPNPPKIEISSFSGSGSWYGDANKISKASNKVDLGDGFYLYNGLPWDAESDTFTVDTDQMLKDLFSYVEKVSPNYPPNSRQYGSITADDILYSKGSSGKWRWDATRMFASSNSVPLKYGFKSGYGGQYAVRDGVQCIGVGLPPAVLDPYYNSGFGAYNATGAPDGGPINYWMMQHDALDSRGCYDYENQKIAIILQKYDDSSVWYLPVATFDAKGHTFPGGVAQTHATISSKGWHAIPQKVDSSGNLTELDFWIAKNGGGGSNDWGYHKQGPLSELGKFMNDGHTSSGDTCWDEAWNVVEPWGVPSVVKSKVIKSYEYRVMGVVVWK